jgi:hypothetical protein
MQHLEGSGTSVLYTGRMVLKDQLCLEGVTNFFFTLVLCDSMWYIFNPFVISVDQ